MQHFFQLFCYLSFLLIIGTIIRAKVRFFQNLFIPASVIGGIAGLIIGPEILGHFINIIPASWNKEIAMLPGLLIIPVITSVPLGMDFGIKKEQKNIKNIITTTFILFIVTFLQLGVGYLVNFICTRFMGIDLYRTFGAELNTGFAGGHGTAGMIGRALQDMNLSYWDTAQGIATTTATFGLVGGIVIGVFLINKACRKGETALLKNPADIPQDLKCGFIKNKKHQPSIGNETMTPSSIDTLAFHIALIFSVSGLSYILVGTFKKYHIPVLSSFSVWAFGMIVMIFVWSYMKKLKLQWVVDKKIKGKISSLFTEFAVVSAVASLPLKAVFIYIVPILIMTALGFVTTWYCIITFCKKYFKDNYPFERAISMMGTSFGVFFTGILLLRICDPEFKLPVLGDYSLGFSLTALIGPVLILMGITLSLKYDPLTPVLFFGFLIIIFTFLIRYVNRKK
ncbi:sodium/glutamate symporter [Fusobacterium sp.]|uniref:sodium/glutamate symporter n=1 Tax=Fusobacterium sp. TaxID=68766 RepID=UPI00396CDDF4